jgi:hypothetical protein
MIGAYKEVDVSKAVIFLCLFSMAAVFPVCADQESGTPPGLDNAILAELVEKVKQAHVPESTLDFVLKRLDVGLLPRDHELAVTSLLDMVKRYDAELRRGKSLSRLNLELKREMLLIKEKKVKVGQPSVITVKEKIKNEKPSAEKEKKVTEVKEKIKEKKEKEKVEKESAKIN